MSSFTFEPYTLVRLLLNDPQAKTEIHKALNDGPSGLTETFGRMNAGTDLQQNWCNLFLGTRREDGSVVRSKTTGRVVANIRPQKTQSAGEVLPTQAQGTSQGTAPAITAEQLDQIKALLQQAGGQVAAPPAAAAAPQQQGMPAYMQHRTQSAPEQSPAQAPASQQYTSVPDGLDDDIPF